MRRVLLTAATRRFAAPLVVCRRGASFPTAVQAPVEGAHPPLTSSSSSLPPAPAPTASVSHPEYTFTSSSGGGLPERTSDAAASPTTAEEQPQQRAKRRDKGKGEDKGKALEKGPIDAAAADKVTASPALPPPRTVLDFPSAYKSFRDVTRLEAFKDTYGAVKAGDRLPDVIRVAGRVTSMRDMGRILFLTIRGDGVQLQVVQQAGEAFSKADLRRLRDSLRVGDIVGATGNPGRTVKGELSLYAAELQVLTPYVCADQSICPDLRGFTHISDADVKYRYRFVDMMVDPSVQQRFRRRHLAVKALRAFLDDRSFVEVETPVLQQVASGANARPFVTHHNANEANLFLRVAPELHLKQCVVGGMDRVYEIGRVFRNEDADRSHNPEFTSCEFYAAYHTYEDLIPMTEEIMRAMAVAANGTTTVTVASCVDGTPAVIDLALPFRRVSVYDEIQRVAGVELPPPSDLNTPRGLAYMAAIMLRYNIPLPAVRTAAKMFDKLIDHFITDRVVEPTFVMDHPLFMSPLAKEHDDWPGLSERFELFVNGTEYCNAYSELNDPHEQYFRFQQQLVDKQTGDDEAMGLDETFLKALQVGLPPTAGWGMGIDRVAMLLSGATTIRDEIIFPLLRQDNDSQDAKRRRKTASSFGFSYQMTLFCLNALEDEMAKHRAPADSMDKVRQLRRCIITKGTHGGSGVAVLDADDLPPALSGWRYDAALTVLRIICGRPKD